MEIRIRTILIALLVTLFPAVHGSAQIGRPENTPRQIRVDVDLVLVNVTVTDKRGRFVQGLGRDHFRIWEDKVEQKITNFSNEDMPLTLGIIVDKSGSMGGRSRPPAGGTSATAGETLQDQVIASAYSCLQVGGMQEDQFFLIEFSDSPAVVADFTNDVSKLREKLLFMGAGGRTALWDAIYAGVTKMEAAANSRKALLVLTDGRENRSRFTLGELKGLVREQEVRIYGMDREVVQISGLGQLAELTGGRIFHSSNPCQELSADLRNQYVIGYEPTNRANGGKWRDIRVRLNDDGLPRELSGLSVRARTGYYEAESAGSGTTP